MHEAVSQLLTPRPLPGCIRSQRRRPTFLRQGGQPAPHPAGPQPRPPPAVAAMWLPTSVPGWSGLQSGPG